MDEIQNKAEAQPAWLQLAAGAAAWAWLSLAKITEEKNGNRSYVCCVVSKTKTCKQEYCSAA